MTFAVQTGEDDLREFFTLALRKESAASEQVSEILDYHGGLNFGQMGVLYEKLKEKVAAIDPDAAEALGRLDVIGLNSEIHRSFLERFAPTLRDAYYRNGDMSAFVASEVFGPSANELKWDALPVRYDQRLRLESRPGLTIYSIKGRKLFVSPYGYQCYDTATGESWDDASSRKFSRSIERYPVRKIDQPVVVVQDQFNGANFAHFLYEHVPRMLHFTQIHEESKTEFLFVFGGVRTAFHDLILEQVVKHHGLRPQQFFFPSERQTLESAGHMYFFSNQKQVIAHPLNMCRSETVQLVRGLLRGESVGEATPRKIYISRRDAKMRRIRNEDAYLPGLAKLGYSVITLDGLSAHEQVALLANATDIVAPHGMGLTNVIFNRNTARVLELFSPVIGTDAYAFVSRALGLDYHFLVGQEIRDDRVADYDMDIDAVLTLAEG